MTKPQPVKIDELTVQEDLIGADHSQSTQPAQPREVTDAQWAYGRSEMVLRYAARLKEAPGRSTTLRRWLLDLLEEGMTRDEVEAGISVFFDRSMYDLSKTYPISQQLRFGFDRAFRLWYITAAQQREAELSAE